MLDTFFLIEGDDVPPCTESVISSSLLLFLRKILNRNLKPGGLWDSMQIYWLFNEMDSVRKNSKHKSNQGARTGWFIDTLNYRATATSIVYSRSRLKLDLIADCKTQITPQSHSSLLSWVGGWTNIDLGENGCPFIKFMYQDRLNVQIVL